MRRAGFTLIELMLASTLAVLLIGGVLFSLSALSRDVGAVVAKDASGDSLKGTLELLQWDLSNARSLAQSPDHRTLVLVGHGAIGADTLRPNDRLVRVVYSCKLRGNLWRLTRSQQYLDDPARPQNWTDLAVQGISAVEVLSADAMPVDMQTQNEGASKMPQWVRVRLYGPSLAVEKKICIR